MNNEPVVERGDQAKKAPVGGCCAFEAEDVARRIGKGVNDVKANVADKLEDGKIAAERLLRRGRYACEDGIEDAARGIKRHPFGALAIAFAAGAAVALLMPRSTER